MDRDSLYSELKEVNKTISKYIKRKNEILSNLRTVEIQDSMPVREQFKIWLKLGGGIKDYSWVMHVESRNGIELFVIDDIPFYFSRYQTINIDNLGEDLLELEESKYVKKEDIEDWMKELMNKDFRSMTFDW